MKSERAADTLSDAELEQVVGGKELVDAVKKDWDATPAAEKQYLLNKYKKKK